VSLILSTLTYYFIEKKIRHHKSRWTIPLLVGAFVLTGILGLSIAQRVFPYRSLPMQLTNLLIALKDRDMVEGCQKMGPEKDEIIQLRFGGDGPKTLFFGDSNMMQYVSRINLLLQNNRGTQRGGYLYAKFGIPPIPGTERENAGTYFKQFYPVVDEKLKSDDSIDRVVIAGRWNLYFDQDSIWKINGIPMKTEAGRAKAIEALGKSIRDLTARGKHVFLLLNIPTGYILEPENAYGRGFDGVHYLGYKPFSEKEFLKENHPVFDAIAAVGRANGAVIIDPMRALCTNGFCLFEDEKGIPIRYDATHLRPGYVREHVKYLDETVAP
jgi:hypothetical protein